MQLAEVNVRERKKVSCNVINNRWIFLLARIVAVICMLTTVIASAADKIGTAERAICFFLSFGLMVLAELWEINQKIDNITITHKIEIEAEKINEDDMGTGGGEQA